MKEVKYKIILSMLLIVTGVFIVKYFKIDYTPTNKQAEKNYWIKKTHTKEKFQIIYGGDSRVHRGVDPQTIEEITGYKGLNLAYSSGGFSAEYFDFISSKLEEKPKKRIIVLGLTPFSFTPDALKNEAFNQYLSKDRFTIFSTHYLSGITSFFSSITAFDIIKKIKRSNHGNYFDFRDNGFIASYKIPSDSTEGDQVYSGKFDQNRFDTQAFDVFLKSVKKARVSGIDIFAFRPLTTQSVKQIENTQSGYKENQVKERFEQAGGKWLSFSNRGYYIYDGSHLDSTSAIRFSEQLADSIQQYYAH